MKVGSKFNPATWPLQLWVATAVAVAAAASVNWIWSRAVERRLPCAGSFIMVHGVRLHYYDNGEGSPIVLIHGNAVGGDDWIASGVAAELQKSHRVIIFDRPGCGLSERPRGRLWTADQQADLIHAALVELGAHDPVIVGHSFGTLVALAYATRHQDTASALILISGYYFLTFRSDVLVSIPTALPVLGDLLRYTISPLLTRITIPFLNRLMFAPEAIPKSFARVNRPDLIARPSQIRATSLDGVLMLEAVLTLRKKYRTLTLPVTIVAGGDDQIVSTFSSQRLHGEISHSTLEIFTGVGHMVHYSAARNVIDIVQKTIADGE